MGGGCIEVEMKEDLFQSDKSTWAEANFLPWQSSD